MEEVSSTEDGGVDASAAINATALSPPCRPRSSSLRSRIMKALLLLSAAIIIPSFLFGHIIYPSSPLIYHSNKKIRLEALKNNGTSDQCANNDTGLRHEIGSFHDRIKLSMAVTSFTISTSLRTVVIAPLMRLQDKVLPLSSIGDTMNSLADAMEQFSHETWEDAARQSTVWEGEQQESASATTSYRAPPELDLNVLVPCDGGEALKYLLERQVPNNNQNVELSGKGDEETGEDFCVLRDIITRNILVAYFKVTYDEAFELATHPVVLRNVCPPESFNADSTENNNTGHQQRQRKLTPTAILNDLQLSNLLLPNYFSDATKTGYDALVPDKDQITLSQFLRGILSGDTPNAKIGTQVIVEQYPQLRDEIFPPALAKELFHWNTAVEDWVESIKNRLGGKIGFWIGKLLPPMSVYPVFIASNYQPRADDDGVHDAPHPRTDLHMEPIGNVASQLHGMRHWTLVPTKWSGLLRPSVSKHRGYFYANMDPLTELPKRLDSLPSVYKCVTRVGDVVWVPPWVWHRVDYNGEEDGTASTTTTSDEQRLSIGASIFHFYPAMFANNLPLFGFLIIPNLIMEIIVGGE